MKPYNSSSISGNVKRVHCRCSVLSRATHTWCAPPESPDSRRSRSGIRQIGKQRRCRRVHESWGRDLAPASSSGLACPILEGLELVGEGGNSSPRKEGGGRDRKFYRRVLSSPSSSLSDHQRAAASATTTTRYHHHTPPPT